MEQGQSISLRKKQCRNAEVKLCPFDSLVVFEFLQEELSVDDIETILDTLIFDGKIEKTVKTATDGSGGQVKLYRAVGNLIDTTGIMTMPCGVCAVSSLLEKETG